jgi:hypothetical protein
MCISDRKLRSATESRQPRPRNRRPTASQLLRLRRRLNRKVKVLALSLATLDCRRSRARQDQSLCNPCQPPLPGLSAKTVSPSYPPRSLPTDHRSRVSPAQTSAASCRKAARPREGRRLLSIPRYSLLWQTVAIATPMLLFAAIRPSTIDVTTRETDQSTRFALSGQDNGHGQDIGKNNGHQRERALLGKRLARSTGRQFLKMSWALLLAANVGV